jgi:hypothetical protein
MFGRQLLCRLNQQPAEASQGASVWKRAETHGRAASGVARVLRRTFDAGIRARTRAADQELDSREKTGFDCSVISRGYRNRAVARSSAGRVRTLANHAIISAGFLRLQFMAGCSSSIARSVGHCLLTDRFANRRKVYGIPELRIARRQNGNACQGAR